MFSQTLAGANYFLKGLRLIGIPGLRRFVAIPLVINILLFGAAIWFAASSYSDLLEFIDQWVADALDLPSWLDWLEQVLIFLWGLVEWLMWPLFILAAVLLLFFGFSLIANVIAAPFNGLLAEAVEKTMNSQTLEETTDWKKLVREALPKMLQELWKLLYFALRAIPFLLLFLIPVVNIAAPFLWFAFGAWMLTLEYTDYPAGNNNVRFRQLRQRLSDKRSLSLGFGSLAMLASSIPIANFLVMPVTVAGATAMWVERFRHGN